MWDFHYAMCVYRYKINCVKPLSVDGQRALNLELWLVRGREQVVDIGSIRGIDIGAILGIDIGAIWKPNSSKV